MTVRVGVIGAGIMGADHANTVARFVSGATVTAVSDLDLARAQRVAHAVGAAAVADSASLITQSDVDAVVIASHDSTHPDLIRTCVRADKPALCEKPLAPTLDDAAAVVRDIGAGASLISLGFMRRFDPGYAQIRQAVVDGRWGAPLIIHSIGRGVSSGPGTTTEYSITGAAIHDLDIVPWLLGSPVVQVSAHRTVRASGVDFQDPLVMLLRTGDGVLSTVEIFLNARYGYDIRAEVVFERGVASLREPTRLELDSQLSHGYGYAADWRPRFADAYRLELQAWIDGIRAGAASAMATVEDGLRASTVADAAIASLRQQGAFIDVNL